MSRNWREPCSRLPCNSEKFKLQTEKKLLLCGSAAAFTRGQKVLLLLLFLGGAGWRRYDGENESKTAFLQLATTLEPPLSRVTSAQTAVLLSVYSFSVYSVCKHTANDRLAPLTSVTCNYMCLHLSTVRLLRVEQFRISLKGGINKNYFEKPLTVAINTF